MVVDGGEMIKIRYGFNGKEKLNEFEGEGKVDRYDFGARMYDARLGRFLSVDPLARKFPWVTPFQFASNSPIQSTDLDGAETLNKVYVIVDDQKTTFITKPNGNRVIETSNGHDWIGTKEVYTYFVKQKGSNDYKYYDSKNPGEAEAKMRADGVKYGKPEITKQILDAPAPPIKQFEDAKNTIGNVATTVSFLFGGLELKGIQVMTTVEKVVSASGVANDLDDLTGASKAIVPKEYIGAVEIAKTTISIATTSSSTYGAFTSPNESNIACTVTGVYGLGQTGIKMAQDGCPEKKKIPNLKLKAKIKHHGKQF